MEQEYRIPIGCLEGSWWFPSIVFDVHVIYIMNLKQDKLTGGEEEEEEEDKEEETKETPANG